jgi:hypothetical protein
MGVYGPFEFAQAPEGQFLIKNVNAIIFKVIIEAYDMHEAFALLSLFTPYTLFFSIKKYTRSSF